MPNFFPFIICIQELLRVLLCQLAWLCKKAENSNPWFKASNVWGSEITSKVYDQPLRQGDITLKISGIIGKPKHEANSIGSLWKVAESLHECI